MVLFDFPTDPSASSEIQEKRRRNSTLILRYSRFFNFTERYKLEVFGEFQNLFNINSIVQFTNVTVPTNPNRRINRRTSRFQSAKSINLPGKPPVSTRLEVYFLGNDSLKQEQSSNLLDIYLHIFPFIITALGKSGKISRASGSESRLRTIKLPIYQGVRYRSLY